MYPRFPFLAFASVFVMLAGSSMIHAGASNKNGNPFGNGTFFQNTGTFSAVVRGQNLSGTMLFSTGVATNGTTNNSSGGSCVISYLGSSDGTTAPGVYSGNSAGMWDPSQGTISGQFWGGYTVSGTNSATIYPEIYNTNTFPVYIQVLSNVIITNTTETVDVTTGITNTIKVPTVTTLTNIIAVEPIGTNSINDSVLMNGSFNGYVQNRYPNQTFSAQGTIVQQQLYPPQGTNGAGSTPFQMAAPLNIPVTVQGIRISDQLTSFTTVSNSIPYSVTTYSMTNILGLQKTQ